MGANQFLECGDLAPLWPLGRLVGPAEPRFSGSQMTLSSDGDKSPAKSGDKSPHSIDDCLPSMRYKI
jgi:hypothetical protein